MTGVICPSCGATDTFVYNASLDNEGNIRGVCVVCQPPTKSNVPCENCGKTDTIHRPYAPKGCVFCQPTTPADLVVHDFEFNGDKYKVLGKDKWKVDAFIDSFGKHVDEDGNVNIPQDTGMCGRDALRSDIRPVRVWLAREGAVCISRRPATKKVSPGRGKKQCPNCQRIVAAACRDCFGCGHKFF